MGHITSSARDALDLQLQDINRDIEQLVAEKNALLARADVCSALACEPGRRTVANNTMAASLRLQAFTLGSEIANLRLKARGIDSRLKAVPGEPVVLTAEQCAAQDDTHNYRSEAA